METASSQAPILAPPARLARIHLFGLRPGQPDGAELASVLGALRGALSDAPDMGHVLGVGEPLVRALGVELPGLSTFPALSGPGPTVPSTQAALLYIAYGNDRGELLHLTRWLRGQLGEAFELLEASDTFTYREGRDLTGYMDGTENPHGDDAARAALVTGSGAGLDGGSFVAVQRWSHDLDAFSAMSAPAQDLAIGRTLASDEEIDDAPASAHVKRAAQEDFDPEAFMLRRSMPYVTEADEGLVFIAYGESLGRYERVLRRMLGLDDGVVDALFRFSAPMTGGYYFCPPMADGGLDLRALGC